MAGYDDPVGVQQCIAEASHEVLVIIDKWLKKYNLSGKAFLISDEVLNDALVKLLTQYTTEPRRVAIEYFIPALLDRIELYEETEDL